MGQGQAAVDINRSADEVWAVVGDFGGIGKWLPGIESCRVEGDDRILTMPGMQITERLIAKDDQSRALTYSIIAGVPVDNHQGVMTVTPNGGASRVTWAVDTTPDEMVEVMVPAYEQGLEALKAHLEA